MYTVKNIYILCECPYSFCVKYMFRKKITFLKLICRSACKFCNETILQYTNNEVKNISGILFYFLFIYFFFGKVYIISFIVVKTLHYKCIGM